MIPPMTDPNHSPSSDTQSDVDPGSLRSLLKLTWRRRHEIIGALRQLLREGAGEFHQAPRNIKFAVLLVAGSVSFGIGVVIASAQQPKTKLDLKGVVTPIERNLKAAEVRLKPAASAVSTLPASIDAAAQQPDGGASKPTKTEAYQ